MVCFGSIFRILVIMIVDELMGMFWIDWYCSVVWVFVRCGFFVGSVV